MAKQEQNVVRIEFRCSEQLKEAVSTAAGKLPLNEYLARVVADYLGRPELAEIPRISFGRPRNKPKKARATA